MSVSLIYNQICGFLKAIALILGFRKIHQFAFLGTDRMIMLYTTAGFKGIISCLLVHKVVSMVNFFELYHI